MLIIACYQIKYHKEAKVNIITCNENLRRQLQRDFDALTPPAYRDDKIKIIDGSATLLPPNPGVVLVDEYDESCKHMLKVTRTDQMKYVLRGFYNITTATRIICFSATSNAAWQEVLKSTMSIDVHKKYPSRYQLQSSERDNCQPFEISFKTAQTLPALMQ